MEMEHQQQQQQQPRQEAQHRMGTPRGGMTFGSLMPYLEILVSAEKKEQLSVVYLQMKNDEIRREEFVKRARVIAGESTIMEALRLMNTKKGESAEVPMPATTAPSSYLPQQQQMKVGQKKPAEFAALQSSQPSKKQKTGSDPVHSLEQMNDLAAVSGVNIREEEENLLQVPKEETRTTVEVRRRLMEEEGRSFLEKGPLHSKVQEIAAKAGLKSISEDVERCLSMCAEEWLWGFLLKSVRNSKQRHGLEKGGKVMTTSDVTKPVLALKKQSKEIRQRKEAEEAERLRKLSEEKAASADDGLTKAQRQQQQLQNEEKMRTNAANIAARKAMGVDDISMKWMFMAQQQKPLKDQEAGLAANANKSPGGILTPRPSARRTALPSPNMRPTTRTVNLKDVVNCLERDPRMSKSDLLLKLYDKLPTHQQED